MRSDREYLLEARLQVSLLTIILVCLVQIGLPTHLPELPGRLLHRAQHGVLGHDGAFWFDFAAQVSSIFANQTNSVTGAIPVLATECGTFTERRHKRLLLGNLCIYISGEEHLPELPLCFSPLTQLNSLNQLHSTVGLHYEKTLINS